jgi:AcrR family transcriptional regulator
MRESSGATRTSNPSAPRGVLNEARWSEVVNAAFTVFSEKGYEAATVQDIAVRVGLLKGSLYYYIESKEAALYAVIERAYVEALAWLRDDPEGQDGAAPTRLSHFIDRWLQNVRRQSAAFVIAERNVHHLSPQHQRSLSRYSREIAGILRAILAQGQDEGVFELDPNADLAVVAIFRLLNGTVLTGRPRDDTSWIETTSWYKRFVLGGLTPPDPKTQ